MPALTEPPTAAYVHIPFCRRRCFYCDFPIAVTGDRARGETSQRIQGYVDILCREIQATPTAGASLTTVFFGGGTPSLLSTAQVAQVLTALQQRFGIAAGAEISMEMDPGTFTRSRLRALKNLGVNRVSLGGQAFQDTLLEACGRTHRRADIEVAIADLQAVAMPAWSLDLISGLPSQTLADWETSLETAIAAAPPHLSLYDLTVEPGTVFHRRYQPGVTPLPSDEATAAMYRLAQATLTGAGYDHYEISNYALPGYQCRHNCVYWQNRPYYGFGMGATSYLNDQRFSRPRTTQAYAQWVDTYVQAHGTLDCPPTPDWEKLLDYLMLGLRQATGISLSTVSEHWGDRVTQQLHQCVAPYVKAGWVVCDPARQRLRLSDPEGFLFSNVVLVRLFETLSDRYG